MEKMESFLRSRREGNIHPGEKKNERERRKRTKKKVSFRADRSESVARAR